MMRYLIITMLFIKRLIKKPAFVMILIVMPLVVTMFNKIEAADDHSISVGIYYEKDALAKTICENLSNKKGYIKFILYSNKDEMSEAVETKKIECGYIFPSDFNDRLDKYEIKRCITCVEAPSSILSSVSDEVVFAGILDEYGKNIAANFIKENNIGRNTGDNGIKAVENMYKSFNTPEKTFSIDYKYIEADEEASSEVGGRSTTYIIHGLVSVLILISGLFGAIEWFNDEKKGLYSSFNNREKNVIGFISIFVPTAIMALSGNLAIYLSNTYTNLLRENIAMFLYVFLAAGFSYLLKVIVKSGTGICALLPAITLGSLIFCPVFIDVSKFMPFISCINKVFPTFYYLNGMASGISGLMLMLVISLVTIIIGFAINFAVEK